MKATEIRIRAGLGEGEAELIVGVESLGFDAGVVRPYVVGNIVAVGPRDLGADGNGQGRGIKAEVIDLDLGCRGFVVRAEHGQTGQRHDQNRADTNKVKNFSHDSSSFSQPAARWPRAAVVARHQPKLESTTA